MEVLQANLSKINIPTGASSVYKDECAYTFHTPESEGGLFVDMNSFVGFSPEYALMNFRRTGHAVYLNIIKKRVPKKRLANAQDDTGAPRVLGIGVPGGFFDRESNFEFETTLSIVVLPDYTRIALPNIDIPTKVQMSVDAIMALDAASQKAEVTSLLLTNDLQPSRYAKELKQLDNGVKISNSGWKCEKCDKTKNLWLNLSDGKILCGRKIVGSELSGNGHALEHYNSTGFPLVVKLGTISADASADVYSYAADENDSVLDPYLEKHLLHFGIDLKEMKKTEKTVAELEVELQHTWEWSAIIENDSELSPTYGPGLTGLINLGNTCYMNSVMQVLFSIPQFVQRYHENAVTFFESPKKDSVPLDFHCQLSKLARAMCSGEHAQPPSAQEIEDENKRKEKLKRDAELAKAPDAATKTPEVDPYDFPKYSERGVRPLMFKSLVGHGHPEFSTNHQQDALEFFAYLVEMISRNEHARGDKDVTGQPIADPTNVLRFGLESRFECGTTGAVGYKTSIQPYLTVPVPYSQALNAKEVEEYEKKKASLEAQGLKDEANALPVVWPQYTLQQCLDALFAPEVIEDWYSSAAQAKTIAYKSVKFRSFPEYLTLQVAKFRTDEGWVPKKVQMKLDVPDELDLEALRGSGLKEGEVPLPEEEPKADASEKPSDNKPLWDESVVAMLVDMGIPMVRAQRASHFNPGAGVDVAMDWVFSHGEDADIDIPIESVSVSNTSSGSKSSAVDEKLVAEVMEMGFPKHLATKALKKSGLDVARAVDWLFSHPDDDGKDDDDDTNSSATSGASGSAQQNEASVLSQLQALNNDGPGKYKLFAFISHIGSSTMSGHYVCHILKDGKWISFNDEKVAISHHPPRDMAYLYFYKRV